MTIAIPWVELLFYIAAVFAPDNVTRINYEVENRTYNFIKVADPDIWYPAGSDDTRWIIEGDSLLVKQFGHTTPHFFDINQDLARRNFEQGDIFVIDKGFTIERKPSGIILKLDLGYESESFKINWIIDDKKDKENNS